MRSKVFRVFYSAPLSMVYCPLKLKVITAFPRRVLPKKGEFLDLERDLSNVHWRVGSKTVSWAGAPTAIVGGGKRKIRRGA